MYRSCLVILYRQLMWQGGLRVLLLILGNCGCCSGLRGRSRRPSAAGPAALLLSLPCSALRGPGCVVCINSGVRPGGRPLVYKHTDCTKVLKYKGTVVVYKQPRRAEQSFSFLMEWQGASSEEDEGYANEGSSEEETDTMDVDSNEESKEHSSSSRNTSTPTLETWLSHLPRMQLTALQINLLKAQLKLKESEVKSRSAVLKPGGR